MFIYHFNRLIRNKFIWGGFAIIVSFMFIAADASCYGTGAEGSAGKLDGRNVSARDFDEIQHSIRGFGRARDNEMSATTADRKTWERIAAQKTVEASGLVATKDELVATLRNHRELVGPNGFDVERYVAMLAENGLTPEVYERILVNNAALSKAYVLNATGALVSPMELDDEISSLTDEFSVRTAEFKNAFAAADMKLKDEDFKTYYDENTNSFALPDRVKVRYASVPVSNYLAHATVTEDDMRDYFDAHADEYTKTVSNETVNLTFDEAKAKIEGVLKLEEAAYIASTAVTFMVYSRTAATNENALTKFAETQKLKVSETGWFANGDSIPGVNSDASAFAEQAFELDPESYDSRFGIVAGEKFVHVIERTDFSAAHVPALAEVIEKVKPRAIAKARTEAFEKAAKTAKAGLEKLLADGKSFEEAAKAQGMNVSTQFTYSVSNVSKTNIKNGFAIAYGARNVAKGGISDAVSISPTASVFVYVADRKQGDGVEGEMMRSQLRDSLAMRRGSASFDKWLERNLAAYQVEPVHPFTEADETDEDSAEE